MSYFMWKQKIVSLAIFFGLPLVNQYHHFTENPTINVVFEDSNFLDRCSNFFLVPTHYLLGARKVAKQKDNFLISSCFNYEKSFHLKTFSALTILTPSFTLGLIFKELSKIDRDVNLLYQNYDNWLKNGKIESNMHYYQKIGLKEVYNLEKADCQNYQRRPDDIQNLSYDIKCLKEVAKILDDNKIPFWIDNGTCLGAYRYGGVIPWDFDVDISILQPDFFNVFKLLKKLDPNLYEVQDWSGRDKPASYLKVYVKSSRNLIDIYTYVIDESKKTIQYTIGNENSIFLNEGWKIRERLYTIPAAFEMMFPLKTANFDGLELPVPNQTRKYLQKLYGENIEPVKIFNPRTNQYEKDLNHPYWEFEYAK